MPTGSLIGALKPLKPRNQVPDQLFLPTYQNQLRIIGRHLDSNNYRSISILEVEGGFLVRAFSARRHTPELLEFPDEGFTEMVKEAIKARGKAKNVERHSALVPTGYEDLLRAMGYELDQRIAKSVTLHEGPKSLYIAGLEAVENSNGSFSHFDSSFDPVAVQTVLDAAFSRRR